MYIHIVNSGEHIEGLERRFSMKRGSITHLNGLADPARLTSGLALGLPAAVKAPLQRRELWLGSTAPLSDSMLRSIAHESSFILLPGLSISAGGLPEILPALSDQAETAGAAGAVPVLRLSAPDSLTAHTLLRDEGAVQLLTASLSEQLSSGKWGGLLLDLPTLPAFDREYYSTFIHHISQALHAAGINLAISVELFEGNFDGFQDLRTLCDFCDRILLLPPLSSGRFEAPAFDEGRLRAPLEAVLRDVPAEKCLLLCPATGWDWAGNGTKKPISMSTAADTACALGARIYFDQAAKSPYFDYRDPTGLRHRVWFEDIRSLGSRCAMAEEYGLAGLAIEDCVHLSPPGLELLCQRLDPL